MKLLDTAKAVSIETTRISSNQEDDVIEVAIAFARHEVTARQVAKALGIKQHSVSHRMYSALQTAARKGYIKLPA